MKKLLPIFLILVLILSISLYLLGHKYISIGVFVVPFLSYLTFIIYDIFKIKKEI